MGKCKKLRRKVILVVLIVILLVWFLFNRPVRFGWHGFGFTVYSGLPFLLLDVKVHGNGLPGIQRKSHFISLEAVEGLLNENPDVLIIGTGYRGRVKVDERVGEVGGAKVKILLTPQAIALFNKLKSAGKTVVAIIHSTC